MMVLANSIPHQYLSDYVTSKQATTQPEWMMEVNRLKQEDKDGKFKGLEMELARTIMEIMFSARRKQPMKSVSNIAPHNY
jgi:hypothetical protein